MTKPPFDLKLNPQSKALLEKLRKHAKAVSLKNSMRAIGISYRKEVKGIFERKQVRDPGLKWPELKDPGAKERARYGDKPLMVRTGTLKKAMTQEGYTSEEGKNISSYGHDFAFFGTDVEYGVYHDNLDEARKKLPLRNFSQPSQSTYGSWINSIDADLNGQLRRLGIGVS